MTGKTGLVGRDYIRSLIYIGNLKYSLATCWCQPTIANSVI